MSDLRLPGWRRARVIGLVAAMLAVVSGCSIGTSPTAERVGDALGQPYSGQLAPPTPNTRDAVTLATAFLGAAEGGNDGAASQVTAFFTPHLKAVWTKPSDTSLTVIRVVGTPVRLSSIYGRWPVHINYEKVGQLSDSGQVVRLADPVVYRMTLWIPIQPGADGSLLIDEINAPDLPGLFISDDQLHSYYFTQPIYFWDSSYSTLVPDLRYLSRNLTPQNRAYTIVQWLLTGPASAFGVQKLPNGTTISNVTRRPDGTLVVKLSAAASAGGQKAVNRLYNQLRWSLATEDLLPAIELQIGNDVTKVDASDANQWNLAAQLRPVAQTFDISKEQVVAKTNSDDTVTALLAKKENKAVVSAAVTRDGRNAALVVRSSGTRALQLVAVGSDTTSTKMIWAPDLGRPVWIPGAQPIALVTANGRLYSAAPGDKAATNVTPHGFDNITAVSVAPDGRRIAFIADGHVEVAQIIVAGTSVSVDPEPRTLLLRAGLVAAGVAWGSDTGLYVVGALGDNPFVTQVTADGVIAEDRSANVPGLDPTDVVSYPVDNSSEVYVVTSQGVRNIAGQEAAGGLTAPFFIG